MSKVANFTHRVFYDNKNLLLFSFIVAIVIWLIVAVALSPTDTAVIKDVPVSIDLTNSVPAQFGLEVFGNKDFSVDVEITGKRYAINSFSVDETSVKVVAQTAYVDAAGKHTLQLKVTKSDDNAEFEISSVSQEYIEVYFDVPVERDFPIEAKLEYDTDLVAEGYVNKDPYLSSNVVTITGPATEVNSISYVNAEISIESPLTQTKTEAAEVNAYNESGGLLHYLTYNYGNSEITVTVPVFLVVDKPTSVSFVNAPSDYHSKPFACKITPSAVNAGVQGASDPDAVESIELCTIDFAQLKPGTNTFTVKAEEVTAVYFLDEVKEFTVTVEVEDCSKRTLTVPNTNINFSNLPEEYIVGTISKGVGAVTVVGPEGSLSAIKPENIYIAIDMSNADTEMTSQEFPAKLSIKGSNDCWVYGEYTVVLEQ